MAEQATGRRRITIRPREAAALSRLLDAYTQTVDDADDPGMDDLRTVNRKLLRVDQDHAAYDGFLAADHPPTHETEREN